MMNTYAKLPAYGHALCPHCSADFDLSQATPTFGEKNHQEALLYVMCPSCAKQFSRCNYQVRGQMMNKCFFNAKCNQFNPDGSSIIWGLTTFFTLLINNNNLVSAVENGAGLTKELYQGLVDGTHMLAVLPGGITFISEVGD